VNGVLVHSRHCDSHPYGVPGHLWLRNNKPRENAVWQALQSALQSVKALDVKSATVVIQHASYSTLQSNCVAETISSWFPHCPLRVHQVLDDSNDWNFEITVNGVLLHSMKSQGHGFFKDEWDQQCLVWKAVQGIVAN